ncbi:MAG TPA: cytochrome b562 [Tepidisphaeraceae bacterium]|nr:cytochrome b562 [Tepidisphaeraceae bacterium]
MTGTNRSIRVWVIGGLTAAGLAAVTLPAILVAQEQPAAPAAPAAPAMKRPEADMQVMNRAFRTLMANAKDATKNEVSLAALATLEQASIASKGEIPPTIASLADAEKTTKLVEYKKEMIKLIRQELDTEEALLAGDNAKAAELVTAMNATQREGHMQFRGRRGG